MIVFTVEEMNLMCIYNTSSKKSLITDLKSVYPYVEDMDMRFLIDNLIKKISDMHDYDFAKINFIAEYA